MKKIFAVILSVAIIFSLVSAGAEAGFGPKFRFESSLNEHEFKEPAYNHDFTTVRRFITILGETFGYCPDAEVDFENGKIIVWLYNSTAKFDCLISESDQRVLVPEYTFDQNFIEYNELKPDKQEYALEELEDSNYKIESAYPNDGVLKVFVYSTVDNKYIRLKIDEYSVKQGEYYITPQQFAQLWYEVHKPDEVRADE